jgi:hypothetical protein
MAWEATTKHRYKTSPCSGRDKTQGLDKACFKCWRVALHSSAHSNVVSFHRSLKSGRLCLVDFATKLNSEVSIVLTFSISKWDSQQFSCTCSDLLQFPIWLDKKTRNFLAWNPNVHFSWLNCTLYFLMCSNTSFRWRYDILLWRWEKHKREVELCWLFLAFS